MLILAIGMTTHAVLQLRKGYDWKVFPATHLKLDTDIYPFCK